MDNNQTAQALFKGRDEPQYEPRLEVPFIQNGCKAEQINITSSSVKVTERMIFTSTPTSRVLCKCGAIAEVDRAILRTKKNLGKIAECRRCRNERISREKEELDIEYFGTTDQ